MFLFAHVFFAVDGVLGDRLDGHFSVVYLFARGRFRRKFALDGKKWPGDRNNYGLFFETSNFSRRRFVSFGVLGCFSFWDGLLFLGCFLGRHILMT